MSKRSFKQEARRDYKGSRKFRTGTGADKSGPKKGRKKYWVAAHKRRIGLRKKVRVKGHWRRIPKKRR